jgi:AraC-like DNA-binding protein
VSFSRESLEKTIATADASSLSAHAQTDAALTLASDARARSASAQLEHVLAPLLADGDVSLAHAARLMRTSPRTLQRQLTREGRSFQAVVDAVRAREAMRLLKEDRRTFGEVAYVLGFSEQSAFFRAFKRWTGKTPMAVRTESRAG